MTGKRPLRGTDLDRYIARMHSHMSVRALADATGASKSTISRRIIAMRKAGELDDHANANVDDGGCAPDERLAALDELIARLHGELDATGGSSLASLSREYRLALEEREVLRAELGITQDDRYRVTLDDRRLMNARYTGAFHNARVDARMLGEDEPDPFDVAFVAVVTVLRDMDVVTVEDDVLIDDYSTLRPGDVA